MFTCANWHVSEVIAKLHLISFPAGQTNTHLASFSLAHMCELSPLKLVHPAPFIKTTSTNICLSLHGRLTNSGVVKQWSMTSCTVITGSQELPVYNSPNVGIFRM